MAALTRDVNTPEREGRFIVLPVAAATVIYGGALVALNAAGCAVPGSAATGLKAVGRAEERADNPGVAGEKTVTVKRGVFLFANSAGADEIKVKNIGDVCYIVDDATVALTAAVASDAPTRSAAGAVYFVEPDGVWVQI